LNGGRGYTLNERFIFYMNREVFWELMVAYKNIFWRHLIFLKVNDRVTGKPISNNHLNIKVIVAHFGNMKP
jgi:hypothetical protein